MEKWQVWFVYIDLKVEICTTWIITEQKSWLCLPLPWWQPTPERLRWRPDWWPWGLRHWPSDVLSDREESWTVRLVLLTVAHLTHDSIPACWHLLSEIWSSRAETRKDALPSAERQLVRHTAESADQPWQLRLPLLSAAVPACFHYTPTPSAATELPPVWPERTKITL